MIARIHSQDFTEILAAARKLDKGALLRLKKKYGTLDIKDEFGIATPATYFAHKHQTDHPDAAIAHDAITLLRKLGACDDFIALGFAAAGNVAEAEKLRKQRGVRLKPLAIGAAMCHETTYAEKLRQQFQLPSSWFIYGGTLSSNHHYVNALIAAIDTEADSYKYIKITQLKALKQTGQISEAVKLNMMEQNYALKVRLDTLLLSDSLSVKAKAAICKKEMRKEDLLTKSTAFTKGTRLAQLSKHQNLEEVITWMEEGGYFYNNEIITYEFTFLQDEAFIENLCCAAERLREKSSHAFLAMFNEGETFINYRDCQRDARQIRRLMQQFLFDYDQANAFLALQEFKTLFFHLVYKSKQVDLLVAFIKGVTGLSNDETQDLLDKYFLFHAKTYTALKLDGLNKKYGGGGLYSYFSQTNSSQKLERVQSLLTATSKFKSFNELEDVLLTQHGLFAGSLQLEPDPQAPKHMQPLSNHDKTCELNPLVDEILSSKFLDKNNMPRVKP